MRTLFIFLITLLPLITQGQFKYSWLRQVELSGAGSYYWLPVGTGTITDTILPNTAGQLLKYTNTLGGFEFVNIDTTDISNFYAKSRSLISATAPVTYASGIIGVDTTVIATRDYAENQVPPTPDEYFTITLSQGNTSPADFTAVYYGWRYSQPGEGIKFNNPAVVPFNCVIVKADMSWRAATCGSSEVIDNYISVWSSAHPPVLQSDNIAIQTAFTCDAGTGTNNWASSGTLAISASAGDLIWAHYVGPWATNPVNITITMIITCKKQ